MGQHPSASFLSSSNTSGCCWIATCRRYCTSPASLSDEDDAVVGVVRQQRTHAALCTIAREARSSKVHDVPSLETVASIGRGSWGRGPCRIDRDHGKCCPGRGRRAGFRCMACLEHHDAAMEIGLEEEPLKWLAKRLPTMDLWSRAGQLGCRCIGLAVVSAWDSAAALWTLRPRANRNVKARGFQSVPSSM